MRVRQVFVPRQHNMQLLQCGKVQPLLCYRGKLRRMRTVCGWHLLDGARRDCVRLDVSAGHVRPLVGRAVGVHPVPRKSVLEPEWIAHLRNVPTGVVQHWRWPLRLRQNLPRGQRRLCRMRARDLLARRGPIQLQKVCARDVCYNGGGYRVRRLPTWPEGPLCAFAHGLDMRGLR